VNGPFGVGKSTLARCLVGRLESACLFNPEDVGGLLRSSLGAIADYRVWPEWRRLVVAVIDQLTRSRAWVVTPMSVSSKEHWSEISDSIERLGVPLLAVVLVGDEEAVARRIAESDESAETKMFRLDYLAADLPALNTSAFGRIVDTTGQTAGDVCDAVLAIAREEMS
jgi:AAA domain